MDFVVFFVELDFAGLDGVSQVGEADLGAEVGVCVCVCGGGEAVDAAGVEVCLGGGEEDVFGFEVGVDDVVVVEEEEGFDELEGGVADLGEGHASTITTAAAP